MSAFGGLVLTNKGSILQTKAQTGKQLKFTRIALGDGELSGSSILDLRSLKREVKSLNIAKLKVMAPGQAVIGSILSNQDLISGFYWRELGVFAEDPDTKEELLYSYGNAKTNAEYIPAGGGLDIVEKTVDIMTLVGNTSNISAVINESLIFETPEGAQEKADAVKDAVMLSINDVRKTLENNLATHQVDDTSHIRYGTASGTNAKTITLDPKPTALVEGMALSFKNTTTNTGTVTLNVNSFGAKPVIKSNSNVLSSGDLKAGSIYTVRFDGTSFFLQGEGGGLSDAENRSVTTAINKLLNG